jgi:hypothetical protein
MRVVELPKNSNIFQVASLGFASHRSPLALLGARNKYCTKFSPEKITGTNFCLSVFDIGTVILFHIPPTL